jgi:hypothetical protein
LEVEERGLVDELGAVRGREADGLVVGSSTSWLLLAVGVPLLAERWDAAGQHSLRQLDHPRCPVLAQAVNLGPVEGEQRDLSHPLTNLLGGVVEGGFPPITVTTTTTR